MQDKHDLFSFFANILEDFFKLSAMLLAGSLNFGKSLINIVVKLEETMLNLLTSAIFQNPKPKFRVLNLSLVNRPVKNAYHTFT